MVSTREKRVSNRSLPSQLDDFDQDITLGNAASESLENTVFNEGTNDRDFILGTSSNISATNKSMVNVKTWKGVLMRGLIGK